MTLMAVVKVALYMAVLGLLSRPLGEYMARVYRGESTWMHKVLGPVERLVTNTNWQAYGGESTLSYFSPITALTVQNFVSAATGMAVLVVLIRGLSRQSAQTLGSFWVDLVRSALYVLLPLSFALALVLVSQGVVQSLSAYRTVSLLQATTDTDGKTVRWLGGHTAARSRGRSVLRTDSEVTAAAIAAEAGVDDFLAETTPEAKVKLIREYQAGGRLVAMTGDGTNDAPALAQADVAVAMNTGTQAAKEAGNMVDLNSNPTKLIEIVEVGKQLLMTRGALTTFSLTNDVAKYFAIVPAAFALTHPALATLNIMGLATPESAIMSAAIFNALVIIALIPLSLRGIRYRPLGAARVLRDNLLIYGVGGIVVPFIGIKAIDFLLVLRGLA